MTEVPTMIIGIDVTHNVGSEKHSIVGFAASLDWYVSKYYVDSISKPKPKDSKKFGISQMTFELEPLFQKAILAFKNYNKGIAPQRIIVYRDSVSEG